MRTEPSPEALRTLTEVHRRYVPDYRIALRFLLERYDRNRRNHSHRPSLNRARGIVKNIIDFQPLHFCFISIYVQKSIGENFLKRTIHRSQLGNVHTPSTRHQPRIFEFQLFQIRISCSSKANPPLTPSPEIDGDSRHTTAFDFCARTLKSSMMSNALFLFPYEVPNSVKQKVWPTWRAHPFHHRVSR